MSDEPLKADGILDTTGLYCPEPIMMMHTRVADMASGDILHVIATDPATQRDIPQFCHYLGHELIQQEALSDSFNYFIRINR